MMPHGSLNEPIGDTPQATDPRRGELLLRAICVGAAEAWPGIARDGTRFVGVDVFSRVHHGLWRLALDPSGVPVMPDALRDALLRAMVGR